MAEALTDYLLEMGSAGYLLEIDPCLARDPADLRLVEFDVLSGSPAAAFLDLPEVSLVPASMRTEGFLRS